MRLRGLPSQEQADRKDQRTLLTQGNNFLQNRCSPAGFTLVEILIVVIILGILASIVIPQFSNASHLSREATLRDDLRFIRSQISAYRIQHRDVSPGYISGRGGAMDQATFAAQMTQFTSEYGATSSVPTTACPLAPYLSRVPLNPLTAESSVLMIADDQPLPDPSSYPIMNGASPYGWIYQPLTQTVTANLPGVDTNGTPYSSY